MYLKSSSSVAGDGKVRSKNSIVSCIDSLIRTKVDSVVREYSAVKEGYEDLLEHSESRLLSKVSARYKDRPDPIKTHRKTYEEPKLDLKRELPNTITKTSFQDFCSKSEKCEH